MALDFEIYIKTKDGKALDYRNDGDHLDGVGEITEAKDFERETHGIDATHRVSASMCPTLYRPGYERGSWPQIAHTLLSLMASENVEKVWYGCDQEDGTMLVTREWLADMCHYWCLHGNRPYCVDNYPSPTTFPPIRSEGVTA